MYIKLSNNRKTGPDHLIENIDIQKNALGFSINLKVKEINFDIKEVEADEIADLSKQKSFSEVILKEVFVPYEEIEKLFQDFGIVTLSFNFTFTRFEFSQIITETFASKKNINVYHEDNHLIPIITVFSPYKTSTLEDCNIVIRHFQSISTTSNIEYDKEISSLNDFIYNDYAWGETNYPKILSPENAKIGEKIYFDIEVPNNRPVYLETNIGVLNKTKVTLDTTIELDLSNIQDIDEDVQIKVSYRYWTSVLIKTINLTN
jgi:hypothetical protein